MTLQQMFDQALQAHRAGSLASAELLYRQLLSQEPSHSQALHFFGVLHHQRGEHQAAAELIRRALEINPNNAEAHNNLGSVMAALGENEQAHCRYQTAVQLNPNYPEAQNNLAVALLRAGRLREAVEHFGNALSLRPNFAAAWSGLGEALGGEGNTQQAVECFERAIALTPDFAPAKYNLAVAHSNLSADLLAQARPIDAIDHATKAIEANAAYSPAHNNLANALLALARHAEAMNAYRRAVELAPDDAGTHSNLCYALHFRPEARAGEIEDEHAAWNARHAARFLQNISPHANDRAPDRRLKIGYVSADSEHHPVGQFMLPLLRGHDREQFEIFRYSDLSLSDDALTEQIRADGIDILVDLSGHTAHNRLLVFARKPAPVQVSYLGYPNTTGLATIDYRITDDVADPIGESDDERLVRLPCAWCYVPIEDSPDASHSDDDRAITFGCFNNFAKVSEELVGLWARLLDETPGSRLLIKSQTIADDASLAAVRKHLQDLGIPEDRLEILPRAASLRENLAMYATIDIALDTFPYHGTTTTCDAMWMGTPVITLAGDRHVSRVGASLLSSVNLTELVAHAPDEYVKLAIDLAHDPARLSMLHSTLRERMKSSRLMNAKDFVHDIESAFREMWRKQCAS